MLVRCMKGREHYHRHPIVSARKPPTGPPRLRPVVAAMLT
jgi:hypothetical protein